MGVGDGIELEMSNMLIPVFSMRTEAAGMQSKDEGEGCLFEESVLGLLAEQGCLVPTAPNAI